MKSYLSLVPISAHVRKNRNKMTVICIILAVFLVTAIFSMADMEVRSQKIRAIADYGNWHIQLRGISESDAALISERSDVAAASWYSVLNYRLKDDYYIGTKRAGICGVEKQLLTDIMENSISEGEYPQKDNEIVLTENSKDILNIGIGDSVVLKIPSGEEVEFTVSGFGAVSAMVSRADAICAFMPIDTYAQFYSSAAASELEDSDKAYYIQFTKHCNIKKSIANIREQYKLTDKQIGQNTMLLGVMGMSSDLYMFGLYLTALVLFLLVLTAGTLMIASSMNSNVAERTEFFGMMRCVGASKKQIMRFVRLEALNWCKTAIPIGVLGGVVITWGLCAALRFLSSSYFADMPVLGISAGGMAAGVIVGLLTVVLAARSPARRAAKTSPLTAVSGNAGQSNNARRSLALGFVNVDTSLGIDHAVRSKKNFCLMTGSFALSIVLFLAFSALITFMNHAVTPLKPYMPDLSVVCGDNTCGIDKSLAEKITGMSGVKRVYGRSFAYDVPANFGDTEKKVTLVSYESNQFNWIDEKNWTKDKIGLEKTMKDTEDGYVLAAYSPGSELSEGSVIKTDLGDLTVAGIVSQTPFDQVTGEEIFICSESLFKKLTGENKYTIVDIQLERKATDEEVNAIRSMSEGFMFSDRRQGNNDARGAYYSFSLFVYGFLAIIAAIAVFNIMNSISMSVSARIKQYGSMRAIGMEIRQLVRMIAAEAVTYAVCGCIAGCVPGLVVHRFLFDKLVTSHWGDVWSVPFSSMAVIVLLTLFTSVAAVYFPSKKIREMSVTETIHAQ